MADQAIVAAERANMAATSALFEHRRPFCDLPASIDLGDGETQTGTAYAATAYVEAYQLAVNEGREALREFTSAVADAYFSDEAQIADATELAHVAPLLSRAWYAHRVAGGTEGLPAMPVVDEEGFCPEPRGSAESQRALELLRIAAPPPEVIRDTDQYDMNDLWTGWSASSPGFDPLDDSLRGRLSVALGAVELETAPPAAIYERFGLPEGAFVEARAHMIRELRAFGRSLEQAQPPDPLGGGGTTGGIVQLYAATRNAPTAPLAAYYGAVGRLDLDFLNTPTSARPAPAAQLFLGGLPRSIAHFTDLAATYSTGLLLNGFGGIAPPLDPETTEIISLFAADAAQQRTGRVQACHERSGTTDEVSIRVWGAWAYESANPPQHLLVRGHDGVQCAVRGSVEGARCVLADHVIATTSSTLDAGFLHGFPQYIEMLVDEPAELETDGIHTDAGVLAFVVRHRPAGGLPPDAAGAYESVAGFFLPRPDDSEPGGVRCETVPVVPELEQDVADALAPSTSYCALSAATCAGLPLDGPIPLENELTEDFDPVESSWRHYLRLARDAADEADRLGEDLIRSGLEQDVRAEQAIDELENLCGVSLNIDSLTEPMGSMGAAGQSCDPAAPCPTGYRCTDGSCAPDAVAIALESAATEDDRRRLVECLGDDTVAPWITLGSDPLCMWWVAGEPTTICEGSSSEYPCPYVGTTLSRAPGMPATSTCDPTGIPDPSGPAPYVAIAVPEALGFFVASEEPPTQEDGPSPQDIPCWALAYLRASPSGGGSAPAPEWVDAILSSGTFNPTNLRTLARRLSWRAAAGDYSSVLVDDAPFISTGSSAGGPGTRWPCGPRPWLDQCPSFATPSDDPSFADGPLFCLDLQEWCDPSMHDPYAPETRLRRARMNDMLARAVLAARVISGEPLTGLQVPYYARSQDEVLTVPTDEGTWRSYNRDIDGAAVFSTSSSSLRIANPGDVFGSLDDYPLFDMNRALASNVANSPFAYSPPGCTAIPAGAEWASCPWDYPLIGGPTPCVEVFDDQPDCDDFRPIGDARDRQRSDRDVPLIVRALGDGSNGDAMVQSAERLWRRAATRRRPYDPLTAAIEDVLVDPSNRIVFGPGRPANVEQLTRYWTRSQCGITNHHNCGGDTFAETALPVRETAGCYSGDANLDGNSAACGQHVGCFGRYASCVTNAEEHGIDFPETFDGNRAFIAPRGLTGHDVLNGLELMCAVARQDIPGGIDCSTPPPIRSVTDLFVAAEYLDCMAARIESGAARTVFRDFPQRAVELMSSGGADGVYGNVSGEYASAVSDLRAALVELADLADAMASTTRFMGADVRALRAEIGRYDIQTEIADWQLASATANQITSCAVAVANIWAANDGQAARGAAAAATCVNSAIQIGIAARITDLQQEDTRLAVEGAFARFEREFTSHSRALAASRTQLLATLERIDASRTRIENLQRAGRRALSRALFLDSDSTGRQYNVNTVMRRRHNTLAIRYRTAHRRAVRLSYLAKRAIEQRLGMEMDRMTDPLPLLDEPPADWHLDVCSMTGIDYDRIRDATPGETGDREGDDAMLSVPENYAGEYVGDYVRKLDLVFESYNLAYPFQDGTDTSVLSLRDELWGIRAPCSVEVPNLLLESGHLDVPVSTDGAQAGWLPEGCVDFVEWPPDGGADAPPRPNCATAIPLDEPPSLGPIPPSAADFGRVTGFRVEFGDADVRRYPDGSPVTDGSGAPAVATTADTRLAQWLEVSPGRYRVSWYARTPLGAAMLPLDNGVPPSEAVRTLRGTISTDPVTGDIVDAIEALPPNGPIIGPVAVRSGWGRYYYFVDVSVRSAVGVAVVPAYGSSPDGHRVADVAALMLEDVTSVVTRSPGAPAEAADMTLTTVAAVSPPAPYFSTRQTRERELEVCEDITGATFRERAWSRGCARLCPDGYGGDCGSLAAETHCYYETSFTLDPEALEEAGLLGGGGFAFGNFNYRTESMGLNIVGTGLRDCTDAGGSTPSTCYASGNIAYSIVHQGPYFVRNHTGGLYSAPLFTGRIERARAVAAERYVTNPLSSADRALIEPYYRTELRGRPLPGTYLLRIWDDPALQFDRLEDVQVVLNYRYWTRQE